jgi:hypothetical protein
MGATAPERPPFRLSSDKLLEAAGDATHVSGQKDSETSVTSPANAPIRM